MIKWLIIYALYEKIKRDNGITESYINLHTITQALRELRPEEMARDFFYTVKSIMEEPVVNDFLSALSDVGVKFLTTLLDYVKAGM